MSESEKQGDAGQDGTEPGEGTGGKSGGREGLWGVSDALRKALASGYKAVVTEDGLKGVIVDAFPKELVQYMMRQTDAARDEVVRVIGQQLRRFLDNIDLAGEIQKLLTTVSFEIRTEIRFVPNEDSVRPKAKVRVRAKTARGDDDAGDGDDDDGGLSRRELLKAARRVVATALQRFNGDGKLDIEVEGLDDDDDEQAEGAATGEGSKSESAGSNGAAYDDAPEDMSS